MYYIVIFIIIWLIKSICKVIKNNILGKIGCLVIFSGVILRLFIVVVYVVGLDIGSVIVAEFIFRVLVLLVEIKW